MQVQRAPVIAVIGSSAPAEGALELAEQLGEAIADAGCALVCGGLGGVMEAACRGAQRAKERLRLRGQHDLPPVIAVLPGAQAAAANPFVDVALPTGMGYARNALVVLACDAAVAVEGGSGTLSEMAYAWQFGKPLAALSRSGGWAQKLAGQRLDDRQPGQVFAASDPRQAVSWALGQLRRGAG